MPSADIKWQFDLSARPQKLIERSQATIDLSARLRRSTFHETPPYVRQAVIGSSLSFSLEQQNSIALLVATGRDSSAAVLVRPILESLCISAWALYRASGDSLESIMHRRSEFPKLAALISQLESMPDCDWIGFRQKTANVGVFHALAHPSILQFSRRYSSASQATAFTIEECLRLLWLADVLCVTCAAVYAVSENSSGLEELALSEMRALMAEQAMPWDEWKDLPRPKVALGPLTATFVVPDPRGYGK